MHDNRKRLAPSPIKALFTGTKKMSGFLLESLSDRDDNVEVDTLARIRKFSA